MTSNNPGKGKGPENPNEAEDPRRDEDFQQHEEVQTQSDDSHGSTMGNRPSAQQRAQPSAGSNNDETGGTPSNTQNVSGASVAAVSSSATEKQGQAPSQSRDDLGNQPSVQGGLTEEELRIVRRKRREKYEREEAECARSPLHHFPQRQFPRHEVKLANAFFKRIDRERAEADQDHEDDGDQEFDEEDDTGEARQDEHNAGEEGKNGDRPSQRGQDKGGNGDEQGQGGGARQLLMQPLQGPLPSRPRHTTNYPGPTTLAGRLNPGYHPEGIPGRVSPPPAPSSASGTRMRPSQSLQHPESTGEDEALGRGWGPSTHSLPCPSSSSLTAGPGVPTPKTSTSNDLASSGTLSDNIAADGSNTVTNCPPPTTTPPGGDQAALGSARGSANQSAASECQDRSEAEGTTRLTLGGNFGLSHLRCRMCQEGPRSRQCIYSDNSGNPPCEPCKRLKYTAKECQSGKSAGMGGAHGDPGNKSQRTKAREQKPENKS